MPNDLFRKAEAGARRLRVSRSQLYATAMTAFLEKQDARNIAEQLDEVYSQVSAKLDPGLYRAQLRSIEKDDWRS